MSTLMIPNSFFTKSFENRNLKLENDPLLHVLHGKFPRYHHLHIFPASQTDKYRLISPQFITLAAQFIPLATQFRQFREMFGLFHFASTRALFASLCVPFALPQIPPNPLFRPGIIQTGKNDKKASRAQNKSQTPLRNLASEEGDEKKF